MDEKRHFPLIVFPLIYFPASSFHNCDSIFESHPQPPQLPSKTAHQCDSDSSARLAPGAPATGVLPSQQHRPASAEPPSVEVCTRDDTTQCNSTNNGGMPAGVSAGAGGGGRSSRRKRFRRRKPFCLRATLANFSIFCRQTSLHGWQYIAQKNSSSAKHMFWAVVVSLSMATAAMFLYNNTMDYLNATVSTTIHKYSEPNQNCSTFHIS